MYDVTLHSSSDHPVSTCSFNIRKSFSLLYFVFVQIITISFPTVVSVISLVWISKSPSTTPEYQQILSSRTAAAGIDHPWWQLWVLGSERILWYMKRHWMWLNQLLSFSPSHWGPSFWGQSKLSSRCTFNSESWLYSVLVLSKCYTVCKKTPDLLHIPLCVAFFYLSDL